MTTLAKDAVRKFVPFQTDVNDLPVIAADIIYEGAAVGKVLGTGYHRPLQAGDPFAGFCMEQADNSSGAAGDINAHVRTRGQVQLSVSGAAITDVGKAVYASDDDTFTLTEGSNSYVGRITRFVSTGIVIVSYDAVNPAAADIGLLTDNTTGTADGTLADVGGAFSQATLNNNFADIAAKLNALARMVRGQ